jgi:hypothetical protein
VNDLAERLVRSQGLYADLVAVLTPDLLASRLGDLRSSTIGWQFWCVTGARHSYSLAAREGGWRGFTSPLTRDGSTDPATVGTALTDTLREAYDAIESGLDEAGATWMGDLVEHEAQHHGQLIRYLYALDVPRPASWVHHYALD